jgi:hypothetical protein
MHTSLMSAHMMQLQIQNYSGYWDGDLLGALGI